jgi:hypothetical protein
MPGQPGTTIAANLRVAVERLKMADILPEPELTELHVIA